jgi:hypothetical protein
VGTVDAGARRGGLALVTVDWEAVGPTLVDAQAACAEYVVGWTAVYRVAWLCRQWPRRLGGDATSDELAIDKKLSNRMAHMGQDAAFRWGGEPGEWGALEGDEFEPEERSAAAVLDWFEWVPAQAQAMLRDDTAMAVWALAATDARVKGWQRKRAVVVRDGLRSMRVKLSWMNRRTPEQPAVMSVLTQLEERLNDA